MVNWLNKNKIILSILILGVLLRFYGLQHGFPYIFHPDEPATIRGALGIRFYINPAHFDWPHLYFYFNYFVFMMFAFIRNVLQSLGLKETISVLFPLIWNDDLIFYYISRLTTAIIGALTIIPMYKSARILFNHTAAVFSALSLAVIPLHVIYSQLALPDIPMFFFICWYIYYTSKIFEAPTYKNYILAGLFLGLSASAKYHGALTVTYILLVHFITQGLSLDSFKKILLAGFFSVIGLLIGSPFILLDFDTFVRSDGPQGALWQFTNVGNVEHNRQLSNFIQYFTPVRTVYYGYTIFYVFITTLILSAASFLKKSHKFSDNQTNRDALKILILGIPQLFIIWLISGFAKNENHYYLIIYPFVILIFSYLCQQVLKNLKNLYIFKLIFVLIVFLPPLYVSIDKTVELMKQKTGKAYGGEIDEYTKKIK